jgi:cyclophilin family peptidyl-prolyl cis-trans isomerase
LVNFTWNLKREVEMKMRVYFAVVLAVILALSVAAYAQDEKKGEVDTKASETEVKAEKAPAKEKKAANPMVILETNYGKMTLELFQKEAPLSVENFLTYIRDGFYDDTIFHRVVKGFVLQAGGMAEIDGKMKQKEQRDPVKNEATNGLSNKRGTLSMARTSAINSGTSHFFINLVDNTRLDHKGMAPAQYGYAVFGKVAEGMDVVDKIALVEVATKGQFQNVPAKPVVIKKAYVVGDAKEAAKKVQKEAEKAEEPAKKDTEQAEKSKELKKEAQKMKDN